MLSKTVGIFCVFSITLCVSVQPVKAGWIQTYCPHTIAYGNWVEQTQDAGYIITGCDVERMVYRYSVERLYIIKTDSLGDTLWTRIFEGPQDFALGRCIRNVDDNGYIILGAKGIDWNTWLLKLDSTGDTVWTRQLAGNDCYCLIKTSGGYVVTGKVSGEFDKLLLEKVNFDGNELWTRIYGKDSSQQWGYSVQETADGGYIVTGEGPETGLWVLRTDSVGDTLWTRLYKFGDPYTRDEGHSIEPASDGGWIIAGAVDYDVISQGALLLMKIDSSGDTVWTKVYDYGASVENGKSVRQTQDGGYMVLGQKGYSMAGKGSIWLLKTDSKGDTLWTRTYGGKPQDRGDCIQLTPDGGYIITGYTQTFSSDTIDRSKQVLLMKVDSLGLLGITDGPLSCALADWELSNPLGSEVTLRYSDFPKGFHALVYDASGRKVDEIHSALSSGTIVWGECYGPGVYFIKPLEERSCEKVVIIR